MTKPKCNLIILGENHSEPQAKEMTLALLKASRDTRDYDKVIFAHEAEPKINEAGLVYRDKNVLKEMWALDIATQQRLKELFKIKGGSQNHYSNEQAEIINFYKNYISDDLSVLQYQDSKYKKNFIDKVNAEINLFGHVLEAQNNAEYCALEDSKLREECSQYISNTDHMRGDYHKDLAALYHKRESSMANTLRDCLVNSKSNQDNKIFVVLLVGADHAKNMENLLKAKIQDENFDLDVTNIIVGKSSHSSATEKYREGDIDHSVNGYLKVKKVDYKPSEDGVGRIEIFHKTKGDSLSESEEQCVLKLESIFGEGSLRSFKRPSSIICGSDDYLPVYPLEQNLKNPSTQTSAVELFRIKEENEKEI